MAENDSSQEKTEEPTAKRLDKAREEGQVPRSKELTTTAVLLAGTFGLLLFGKNIGEDILSIMQLSFSIERAALFDSQLMFFFLGESFRQALIGLIPIFLMLLIAAIAGPIALGGWLFSTKSLAPKLDRMNPLSGLKRMFSVKSLVELFKSVAKVLLVGIAAFILLLIMKDALLGLSREGLQHGIAHSLTLSIYAAIILSAVTIIIVLIDVPFQIHEHVKKLKMSRQDVKDEMKDTEGKPEVKSRIRQLQMEMSQRRMMDAVPEADVVITNPTHFSVALKYDPEKMETPILIAKGIDHMALKIREIAKLHNIEFVEAPPLARAVYYTTEVEDEIPEGLFVAVAQVLAYVFQLREFRNGRSAKPSIPKRFDLPKDMQFD